MARIHRVKKSRKEYTCRACQGMIAKGQPYQWFKSFRWPKSYYHDFCRIPHSHRTTSEKLSTLYAIQERLEGLMVDPDMTSLEEIQEALEEAAQEAEDVGMEYQDSADNIEEYFPSSEQADTLREKADIVDAWVMALQAAIPDDGDTVEEALERVEEAIGELEL